MWRRSRRRTRRSPSRSRRCGPACRPPSVPLRMARFGPAGPSSRHCSRQQSARIEGRGALGTSCSNDYGPGGRVAHVTLVLLTGATRGIGQAAAIELVRQGADVALVGRDPERVKAVAAEAAAAGGGQVHEHVADLMLMSDVRALADEVRGRYEKIDVLANNAGALFASRKTTSE